MIQPTASFRDNLSQLPGIDSLARIELLDAAGTIVASIPNEPGKQGSLAVYQALSQDFAQLDTSAAAYGIALFAEHSADAQARPGAHPNIDRLFAIQAGEPPLSFRLVAA